MNEMDTKISSDAFACAVEARVLYTEWVPDYSYNWREKDNKKKLAYKYVRQAAKLSGYSADDFKIPKLIEDIPVLCKYYLKQIAASRPETYFDYEVCNDKVTIKFKSDKGKGWLSIPRSNDSQKILCLPFHDIYINEYRYTDWADDPYPVGPDLGCYRVDDSSCSDYGHLMLIVDHPVSGGFTFPKGKDELLSVIALAELADHVVIPKRTQNELDNISNTARSIYSRCTGPCFGPADGICSTCCGDITKKYPAEGGIESITGCPLCGRTWCD